MTPPVPDLTEFEAYQTGQKRRCGIARALNTLPAEECKKLEAALKAHKLDIPAGAIAAWLCDKGAKTNNHAVSCHRRQVCSCYDER